MRRALHFLSRSERDGEDEVVVQRGAYLELAGADDFEAVATVEAEGGMVLAVDAEQEAGCAALASFVHGPAQQGSARAVPLKAMEHVDALEFEVAGLGRNGEIGLAEDGVAGGGCSGRFRQAACGLGAFEPGCVHVGGVLVLAVEEDVLAGEDVGVAFEKGGLADEGEAVSIGGRGLAEGEDLFCGGVDAW